MDPRDEGEQQPGHQHEDQQAVGPAHPAGIDPQHVPLAAQPHVMVLDRLLAEQRRRREAVGLLAEAELGEGGRPLLGQQGEPLEIVVVEFPLLGPAHGGQDGQDTAVWPQHGHRREALVPARLGIVRLAIEAGIAADALDGERPAGAHHEADQPHGGALAALLLQVRVARRLPEGLGGGIVEQAVTALGLEHLLHRLGRGAGHPFGLPLRGDRLGGGEEPAREHDPPPLVAVPPLGGGGPAAAGAAQQGHQVGRRHRLLAEIEDAVAVDQLLEQGGIGAAGEDQIEPRLGALRRIRLLQQPLGPIAGDGGPQGQHADGLRPQEAQGLPLGIRHEQVQLGPEVAQAGLDRLTVKAGQQRGGNRLSNLEPPWRRQSTGRTPVDCTPAVNPLVV